MNELYASPIALQMRFSILFQWKRPVPVKDMLKVAPKICTRCYGGEEEVDAFYLNSSEASYMCDSDRSVNLLLQIYLFSKTCEVQ